VDKEIAKNVIAVKINEAIKYLMSLDHIYLPLLASVTVRRGCFEISFIRSLS